MGAHQYVIPDAIQEKHPSALGVIPPLLRIHASSKPLNIPLDTAGFFEDIQQFMDDFDYAGQYHDRQHLNDVVRRFLRDIENLKIKYPNEFGDTELLQARIAGITHDIVHNGYGKDHDSYFLTPNSICALYGFAPNRSHILPSVIESLNFGIDEDNKINNGSRPFVYGADSVLELSEEEMSQIVADAFLYRNGFDIDFRLSISGMLQATEFKRSMHSGKPSYKWPRTQMELLTKLADIGNFTEDLDQWIKDSVNVNTELPFFTGTSVMDFINEELYFINTYVKPVLDADNQPSTTDSNGDLASARVPVYYRESAAQKEAYLQDMRSEIEAAIEEIESGKSPKLSAQLKSLKEAVRPCLGKTDPTLLDGHVDVPLVHSARTLDVAPLSKVPGAQAVRKILGR